jgi:hypothetical protein
MGRLTPAKLNLCEEILERLGSDSEIALSLRGKTTLGLVSQIRV